MSLILEEPVNLYNLKHPVMGLNVSDGLVRDPCSLACNNTINTLQLFSNDICSQIIIIGI